MADKVEKDEREEAITARMTESRGALNRQQAELAVDHQIENDKQVAAAAAAAEATKKAAKK